MVPLFGEGLPALGGRTPNFGKGRAGDALTLGADLTLTLEGILARAGEGRWDCSGICSDYPPI